MAKEREILSVICFNSEQLRVLHNYVPVLSKLTSKRLLIFNRIIATWLCERIWAYFWYTSPHKSPKLLYTSPEVTAFFKTLMDSKLSQPAWHRRLQLPVQKHCRESSILHNPRVYSKSLLQSLKLEGATLLGQPLAYWWSLSRAHLCKTPSSVWDGTYLPYPFFPLAAYVKVRR